MEKDFFVEFGIVDKADLSLDTLKRLKGAEKIPLEEYIDY